MAVKYPFSSNPKIILRKFVNTTPRAKIYAEEGLINYESTMLTTNQNFEKG